MQKEILDLDSSIIISNGTIERVGYLPRITEEVHREIIKHGINPSTGTYQLDCKSPRFSDFTSIYSDSVIALYIFDTSTQRFFIEKFAVGKSSCISLCGNQNHPAVVMITNTDSGRKYGICKQILSHDGDFSLVSGYIFYPEDHKQFEPPRDKCLGHTLKNIVRNKSLGN